MFARLVEKKENKRAEFEAEKPEFGIKLNYNRETDRIESFKKFSNPNDLDIKLMAITGLYFNKDTNEIKCYFCKYSGNFTSNKDIVSLHYKNSRNCPLMTRRNTQNVPVSDIDLDLKLPPLFYDDSGSQYTDDVTLSRKPIYPQFLSEEKRMETYKTWPKQLAQKPDELAESGFFYVGERDEVKCFYCGSAVKDWDKSDEPWIEHAKINNNCSYVDFVKGKEFIELVHKNKLTKLKDIKPHFSKNDNFDICSSCNRRDADVTFLPCDHTVLCSICAFSRDKCAKCNVHVNSRIRTYF